MSKTGIYPLVGLSKPKTATLLDPRQDFFWVSIEMPADRILALWDFCKNHWDEPKFAIVKFDKIEGGVPIDGVMIELLLKPNP